jgi:hypothetical protein
MADNKVKMRCTYCDEDGVMLNPDKSSLKTPQTCIICGGTGWVDWGKIPILSDIITKLDTILAKLP